MLTPPKSQTHEPKEKKKKTHENYQSCGKSMKEE